MTVRRFSAALIALSALLLGAGCGGSGNTVVGDETNDSVYQQAQDLKKQGRPNEALNAFLKEIDRRGENGAPESHLEAGALYLNWSHNPVEAYHHFSKYLELQPTGPRANIVRGQRDAAMREIARFLLAPANGQGGADRSEEVEQLRRQIDELKAENQALRGASSVPVVRAPPMIALPDENAPANVAADDTVTPVTPAQTQPPPTPAASSFTRGLNAPRGPVGPAAAAVTAARPPVVTPATRTTPSDRIVSTPTRPTAPQRPGAAPAAAPGRRSHTVTAGEKSLWGIARQYYPSVNQARVTALYEANRDVMRTPNDLRAGMVLRIP